MVEYIRNFNLEHAGDIWGGNKRYRMLIISEFDDKENEIGRKVIYITPETEKFARDYVEYLYKLPNYSRVSINNEKFKIEKVRE